MLIPNSVWKRVQNEFHGDELAEVIASVGSIACPSSTVICEDRLSRRTRDRLETAVARLNPGA